MARGCCPPPEWFLDWDDARTLREYYGDWVTPDTVRLIPFHIRLRARAISAAREEARLEMGKGAMPVLPI